MENFTDLKSAFGRRKSDLLPGVEINDDGSLHMKLKILESLNQRAVNLSMLMDSARSIMAEMSLDNLLGLIMESVTRVMDADRSTLFLVDLKQNEIWSRVAQGSSEIRIPLGEGIAGHVANTGEVINIPDAYKDPRFNSDFDMKSGYRTKSILCMPVYDPRGTIIGVIQVLNKLDGTSFFRENEDLLSAFCSLAGISLANAQAYEELEKERDLLEVRVRERTADLEQSRKKSDELLLNILPEQIADELKEKGRAAPRRYDRVSVLFTDFKGFTGVAEKMDPEMLIGELDSCFYNFDILVERFNLEKIKTIGDSYMCAGGIPEPNNSNPVEICLAALGIQSFMHEMSDKKKAEGKSFWEIRIGVHTGPVIAGVVGKKKFAYDIWGDAVNIASRMESSGEPGKVNISE
ncbi:MAG: GAF domain-containing protein, partial [Spirochaetia bacterium]|nr:GAF domain-containing protein [Spirochaetia bacterium]